MKLKIPPAVLVLIVALLMWGIYRLTDTKHLNFEHQETISWVFFSIGTLIGIIAVFSFRKARTSVDPTNPEKASQLVVTGIYKFTRNPMYLGLLFILIGFAIKLGNLYSFIVLPLYVWYITTFQIKVEEEALTEIFKEDFTNYKNAVRRWL